MTQYGDYNNELAAALLMAASGRLNRKKQAKKSNFGISVRSSAQNKKRRNKRRIVKQSRKNNR